jgi:type VI secretion system protein ImpF
MKPDAHNTIQVSLLDRLVDEDPKTVHEPVQFRLTDFRHIKSLVTRDLENLLNTRCGLADCSKHYPETNRSVLYYGLKDYSAESPNSSNARNRIVKDIDKAIQFFEPRLKNIKVHIDEDLEAHRGLAFRITGVLVVDPIREPVAFDTYYDASRKEYVVAG